MPIGPSARPAYLRVPSLGESLGEPLSESTAFKSSLYGTLISWTVLVGSASVSHTAHPIAGTLTTVGALGTLFGPSFGHLYAHTLFTRGFGLRLAGLGLFAATIATVAQVECEDSCSSHTVDGLAITALALYAIGSIDDIATAHRDVRRYNQRLRDLAITPMIRGGTGLVVSARF